jgi:hypothetical protein
MAKKSEKWRIRSAATQLIVRLDFERRSSALPFAKTRASIAQAWRTRELVPIAQRLPRTPARGHAVHAAVRAKAVLDGDANSGSRARMGDDG